MRKILIISPHYPPSNLAAVHRARYFAQYLPGFGWQPIILTVHENYYEEKLDWQLLELIPKDQRIEKVSAIPITKPRIIGDLGLRAFFQLRGKALDLIKKENIDFVYILIPSFYVALLGPYLFRKTKVPYGIDYIDPWVHRFPGSDVLFSRHWFSSQLAKILEPIAVKHASLITGVSEGYYLPVLGRNTHLQKHAITVAMPYGAEENDFNTISNSSSNQNLTHKILIPNKESNKIRFVYAGTFLPKAKNILESLFRLLSKLDQTDDYKNDEIEFHFIGTLGTIKPLAEKYNVWNRIIFEYPNRIDYVDVLRNLSVADGIFILGSTESHYTPSKVFQAILSRKPIFAILHKNSTATQILKESGSAWISLVEDDNGNQNSNYVDTISIRELVSWVKNFNVSSINLSVITKYSALNMTEKLVSAIEQSLVK